MFKKRQGKPRAYELPCFPIQIQTFSGNTLFCWHLLLGQMDSEKMDAIWSAGPMRPKWEWKCPVVKRHTCTCANERERENLKIKLILCNGYSLVQILFAYATPRANSIWANVNSNKLLPSTVISWLGHNLHWSAGILDNIDESDSYLSWIASVLDSFIVRQPLQNYQAEENTNNS